MIVGLTELDTGVTGGHRHPLNAVFAPRSVAIIGASQKAGSVGLALTENLTTGRLERPVFLVNPKHKTVLGRETYESVAAIGTPVDLAVIATPAASVPEVIRECASAGVGAVIIVSAGFRECGEAGLAREQGVLAEFRSAGRRMPIIGPNCLGVAVPSRGLNATFARRAAHDGSIAFLSQSGALCTAVLDWSVSERVGFSAFVSVGSMLDVGWGELLDYFADDHRTRAIAIYMEGVGDARSFLSAAREVALTKPIVVLKAGRTEEGAKAVVSHTGALTGADAVIDAAFERAGVLRVDTLGELFDMVDVLDKQPRPRGPSLAIVTNAGGPGTLAVDALLSRDGKLASLSQSTIASLDRLLPPHWSRSNPIDVLGDAGPDRFAAAVRLALDDPATDGLLALLTPQAMTDPTSTASGIAALVQRSGKPLLASWMGGEDVEAGRDVLRRAGIATFGFPDEAARAFHGMWRQSANIAALYETVTVPSEVAAADAGRGAAHLLASARQRGETLLSESASKQLLELYGIPCVPTFVALEEDEACAIADRVGYPVVLKIHSTTITHKAASGGVRLNLRDAAAVRKSFGEIKASATTRSGEGSFQGVSVQPMVSGDGCELIVGSSIDPQFGPVMLFGFGGRLVEAVKDQALALPPLNVPLARRLIERTRIGRALAAPNSRNAVDLTRLEQLIVRFSQLVVEQRSIREIEINPLFASQERLVALDARVNLYPADVPESQLSRPAIRPYPAQYTCAMNTRDGRSLLVRPIRPSDEQRIVRFHQALSDRTVHCRYGGIMNLAARTAHERLIRSCFIDFDRQIALVAVASEPSSEEIVGVVRLLRQPGSAQAEFAIVVADAWQRRGVGRQLLKQLISVAKAEGIQWLTATIVPENEQMIGLCRRLGFTLVRQDPSDGGEDWTAEMQLDE